MTNCDKWYKEETGYQSKENKDIERTWELLSIGQFGRVYHSRSDFLAETSRTKMGTSTKRVAEKKTFQAVKVTWGKP